MSKRGKPLSSDQVAALKTELAELLDKYDARICFTCSDCSDTYGLTGEQMVIYAGRETVFSTYGWGLDASDLREDT